MKTPSLLSLTLAAYGCVSVTGQRCAPTEPGYDFVGNDVANAQYPSIRDCCVQCISVPGCNAYSWSNHSGGTCWFKSGKGKVVVNPAVTSVYRAGFAPACTAVEEGIDYVGNDIGNVPSPDVTGCCQKCQAFPGCRAFTWTAFKDGTCWLKSSKQWAVVDPAAKSMEAYRPGVNQCTLWTDTDFTGFDIGNAPAANPTDCCQKCKDFKGCRAYTWTDYNGGTCWLKDLQGPPTTKAGAQSAVVYANPNCALQKDVDFVGNDIGNVPSTDPNGCCGKCANSAGCQAFTWSNHNGGTCWLKSAKGATAAKTGLQSAVVILA